MAARRVSPGYLASAVLLSLGAALALVELEGRHAEVEHDSVHGREANGIECPAQIAERCMAHGEPGVLGRQGEAALGCIGISIDTDDPTLGLIEDGATVAAATEGRVDIDPIIPQPQGIQDLVE